MSIWRRKNLQIMNGLQLSPQQTWMASSAQGMALHHPQGTILYAKKQNYMQITKVRNPSYALAVKD